MIDNYNINISIDSGNDIVGIWFEDNTLNVTFPKNYTVTQKSLYEDIQILSLCFDKYKKIGNQKNVNHSFLHKSTIYGDNNFSLISLFRLINRFIEDGYYYNSIETFKLNGKGEINFNKTINKLTPYVVNDSLIYLDFIIKDTSLDYNNPLTLIHKYVIEKAFNIIGVFFPQIEFETDCKLPFSKNYCITLLEKVLSETFNDEIRDFWQDILSCFKLLTTSLDKYIFYQTNNFEILWESMLHDILCNVEISDFYFNSSWYLINSESKKNKPSRPDIINIDNTNKIVSILDAKYYSYSNDNILGTLPSTSDINKQILYKYNTKKILSNSYTNINYIYYNLFLLPGNSNFISYLGYAISEFDINEKVHALSLNIKEIMKTYSNSNYYTTYSKDFLNFIYNSL